MNNSNGNFLGPITAMSVAALVFGYLTATAWISNDHSSRASDPEQRERLSLGSAEQESKIRDQNEQIKNMQAKLTKLENAMAQESGQAKVLNDNLQDIKEFAGLTPLSGPGVIVTLTDVHTDKMDKIDIPIEELIIHDRDIVKVVNELWNAGAEAISVNGNRVVVGTSFRCVGSTVLMDTIRIASPFVLKAIGNSADLEGAFKLPGGIYDELRNTDPKLVAVEKSEKLDLPDFGGKTTHKYAKTITEQKQ